jgi:hypothetical protein
MVIAAITAGIAITLHRDRPPRRTEPRQALVLLWFLAAVPSFLMGGQFYNHYWIIVALPLSVVAGVLVGTLRRSGALAVLTVVAVCPALWSTWRFVSLARSEVPHAIGADESSTREEQIAHWFEQVRRPSDSLYVLCAGASIYALADVDPPYRALWFYEVHHVRGAQEELSTLLTSDDRPTFVVAIQKPKACGLTGEDADLLDDHYDSFATVGGTDIYIRAGDERIAVPRRAPAANVQSVSSGR